MDGGVRLVAGNLAEAHMIRRRKSLTLGIHTCPVAGGQGGQCRASRGPLGSLPTRSLPTVTLILGCLEAGEAGGQVCRDHWGLASTSRCQKTPRGVT